MGDPRRGKARSGRRGSALVYALATVLLIGGLSASFLQLSTGMSRRQAEGLEKKEAFYLAEAGLTEALVGLRQGRTGNVGSMDAPASFGDGLFWVEATGLGAGLTQLECTAMTGGARATLSLVSSDGSPGVAALGLFGLNQLEIMPGSLIDAYESAAGAYVPPAPKKKTTGGALGGLLGGVTGTTQPPATPKLPAIVGSGGGVTISGTTALPTMVQGDVFSGPDTAVTVSGDVTVTGTKETMVDDPVLPAVSVPDLPSQTGIDHSGAYPLVVPAGAGSYPTLRVQSEAQVVVQGPATLVVGALEVDPGGTLTLDASGGPIQLFVTDGCQLAPSSTLTVTPSDPTQVSIQLPSETEDPVELFSNASFYGYVYAPNASVQVASSFEVFGSLVAEHLSFLGPVKLHFDHTLAAKAEAESHPSLFSWRIVELENQIGSTGADPFVLLGLDPSVGRPPAKAHGDQLIDIQFFDLGLTLQTYQGLESSFDWGDVSAVVLLERDGVQVHLGVGHGGVKGLVGGLLPIPIGT